MTVEKFLSFWSQHNTSIIEGLIALIIFFALFLAYRSFFSKKDAHDGVSHGSGLNAAELEKTLQKILEAQSAIAKENHASAHDQAPAHAAPVHHEAAAAGESHAPESEAEVAQLRLTLSESQKKIEALQEKLTAAEKNASDPSAPAPVPAAGGDEGISSAEREELNNKLRDLEARLAEYEIISEDIADLSKYRDENDSLKKEIEALKAGGASSAAPVAAAAEEPAKVEEVAPVDDTQAMIDAALALAIDNPASLDEQLAADPVPTKPPPPAESDDSLIDDDLMREFEAAVAGQKASSLEDVAEKAGDGSEEAKSDNDTDKLMDEFESFVTKKS